MPSSDVDSIDVAALVPVPMHVGPRVPMACQPTKPSLAPTSASPASPTADQSARSAPASPRPVHSAPLTLDHSAPPTPAYSPTAASYPAETSLSHDTCISGRVGRGRRQLLHVITLTRSCRSSSPDGELLARWQDHRAARVS
jgi:hypothetical protein